MFRHIPGKWISTGTEDTIEAIRFAEGELSKTLPIYHKIPTLEEFSSKFFSEDRYGYRNRNEKRNLHYENKFYTSHQARLDTYIIPEFGAYLIDSITDVIIEDWLLNLLSKKDGKELSDDSKNKILLCFRIVMHEAKRKGLVSQNPADRVKMINATNKPRLPFTPVDLIKLFPRDEFELLRIWQSRMWAVYFLIMRDTGFRPGEVAALTRESYVPEYRGIYSEQSVDYTNRSVKKSIKTTRSGQPYKVGVLSQQTVEQLNKHLLDIKNEYLFTINDRMLIPEVSNKHLRLSAKRADIDLLGRTQYSLRHSFETDISGKVENKILLELMAHTSYRGEYDHRTPAQILKQLQPVCEILDKR